jgi:hypothetical protein
MKHNAIESQVSGVPCQVNQARDTGHMTWALHRHSFQARIASPAPAWSGA